MISSNDFLLMTHGAVVVMIAFSLVILIHYLDYEKRMAKMSWRELLKHPPRGINTVVPVCLVLAGTLITRGALWSWRKFSSFSSIDEAEAIFIGVGTIIITLGLTYLVYLTTKDRLGAWPSAVLIAMFCGYVAINLSAKILI